MECLNILEKTEFISHPLDKPERSDSVISAYSTINVSRKKYIAKEQT
jgi:hypothetical protein